MQKVDCIIVGGGLAGTVLAMELSRAGKSLVWYNEPSLSSSTRVAAGIMNPLVFRYLTEVWKAEDVFPFALNYYQSVQDDLQTKFLHPIELLKIFGENDQILWKTKSQNPKIGKWIREISEINKKPLKTPFGCGLVNAAWLDTALFLKTAANELCKYIQYRKDSFDATLLQILDDEVLYNDVLASKVIFCEGHLATNNPYFQFIPFRPVKGELIDLKIEGWLGDFLISKDIFLLPVGEGIFRLGSTYDWNDLSEKTTDAAKDYLIEKLHSILDLPIEIVHHRAGVRPAIADRRPVVGLHPKHSQIAIFNGLGARGVMLAPFFGQYLCHLLTEKAQTIKEVDPARFNK